MRIGYDLFGEIRTLLTWPAACQRQHAGAGAAYRFFERLDHGSAEFRWLRSRRSQMGIDSSRA